MLGDQDRDEVIKAVRRENRRATRTGLSTWFMLGAPAAYSFAYGYWPQYRDELGGLACPAALVYVVVLIVWARVLRR